MASKKKFTVVHSGTTKVGTFYIMIQQPSKDGVFIDTAFIQTAKLLEAKSVIEIPEEKLERVRWQ